MFFKLDLWLIFHETLYSCIYNEDDLLNSKVKVILGPIHFNHPQNYERVRPCTFLKNGNISKDYEHFSLLIETWINGSVCILLTKLHFVSVCRWAGILQELEKARNWSVLLWIAFPTQKCHVFIKKSYHDWELNQQRWSCPLFLGI